MNERVSNMGREFAAMASRESPGNSGQIREAIDRLAQESSRYEEALGIHMEALRPALRPGAPVEGVLADTKNPNSRSAIAEMLDEISGRIFRCTEELRRATKLLDI